MFSRTIIFISLATYVISSCGITRQVHYEETYKNRFFEISTDSFRYKKETYQTLHGIIRDSSNRYMVHYQIQSVCGCVRKTLYPNTQYKLTTQLPVDILLTEEDIFVFKKLSAFSKIDKFCSRTMLDSAKGFIKLTKKTSH